jgi:tetratricopeptide (TPR) repeat protein
MPDQPRIHFLSVPENLRGSLDIKESDFSINPDIPIPVEIPQGEEGLNLEELSWEMIISGMLRVIASEPGALVEDVQWIHYYRHFVLAVRPTIMDEFTEAAILKSRNGDFDLSLEILDSLRGLFPLSPVVKLNRALVMEQRAAFMENRNRVESASFLEDESSLENRSFIETETAFIAAEEAYAEALALMPPFPGAFYNAGFFYLDRKNFPRAMECFSQYIELADSPEDEDKKKQAKSIIKDIDKNGLDEVSFSDACKLIRQGKEEAGMRSIRDYIEQHPDVWNGWFVLGWALRRICRWEDAAAAFNKAIELGGGNNDTRNELAICLMELGDLPGARHELETALHKEPENVKIISNMGVLALKNNNTNEAAAFFRTVLDLDPNDPIANSYLKNKNQDDNE